jgi:hypothetical protein
MGLYIGSTLFKALASLSSQSMASKTCFPFFRNLFAVQIRATRRKIRASSQGCIPRLL